jgi:hypothetical protein
MRKKQEPNIQKIIQTTSDSILGLVFLTGLVPFVYFFIGWVAVGLAIVSLVIAHTEKNQTKSSTIANLVFTILGFIPILGAVFKILGIIFVTNNIIKLWKR